MRATMTLAVSDLIASTARSDEGLLDQVAAIVCQELGILCAIGLLSDDRRDVHPVGLHHIDEVVQTDIERTGELAWPATTGATARVLRTGRAESLTPEQAALEPRPSGWALAFPASATEFSALVAPVRVSGTTCGVVVVVREAESPMLSDRDGQDVQQIADLVGLVADARHLDAELERLRTPYRPALPDPRFANLTAREVEILGMIGEGLTNRDIAERLYLSIRTVEWHRSRLAAKLGAPSRSELIALGRTFSG
jgi:DNA-binding CsgD family transcriptional regulator